MTETRIQTMARWATHLELDDVPEQVLELCRAQRRSVIAAMAASQGAASPERVLRATLANAGAGPTPTPGSAERVRTEDALIAASALSIALDYDDYLLFGHTGHSAVLVPLLMSAETGASGQAQLLAQLVANEVEARLGAACVIGPLNGQLWSFIHAGGAALAAGRLLALSESQMAHALAISLYQAPRPTPPGFMAPDSKLLTAADPTLVGLRAARMAAHGVTGPLDVLDHPSGFLSAFTFQALPSMLGGLGDGWATRTLCIKPYPGCAYIDTTVDALLSLGWIDPVEVSRIDVVAGAMTCGMDGMSKDYARDRPTPVTVNFSIPWNVAIVVLTGRLTPAEVNEDWLLEHESELRRIVERVELKHGWELSRRTLEALTPVLSPRAMFEDLGARRMLSGLGELRREHGHVEFSARDLVDALLYLPRAGAAARSYRPFGEQALERFQMTFPAHVRVTLRSGRVLEAEANVPRGGAGCAEYDPIAASHDKLRDNATPLWGEESTRALAAAIDTDDDDLVQRLADCWAASAGSSSLAS
ncbi:MAG: MmgE/PrpD family protein [Deltaproteobacteria bacterium]|nr:MmgE/PrpD family protein [Deltaproteobacteria bacterium]